MTRRPIRGRADLRRVLTHVLTGPQALAFLPALVLTAFWVGGRRG
ncbi:hypothetical protein [Pseudooceanicola sp. LIPI14-2-Ac024]